MLHHICLSVMLIVYSISIYSVFVNYSDNNNSISSILKKDECNECVSNSMIIMGIFTLIYEYIRKDILSFVFIGFLLIGIYGLLFYDDTTFLHYIFSCIAFTSILVFMFYHTMKTHNYCLFFVLLIQICLSFFTIAQTHILHGEIYLLANFCLFYLVLHFMQENHNMTVVVIDAPSK